MSWKICVIISWAFKILGYITMLLFIVNAWLMRKYAPELFDAIFPWPPLTPIAFSLFAIYFSSEMLGWLFSRIKPRYRFPRFSDPH